MSSSADGAAEIAGFWTAFGQLGSPLPPLVFLHGSSNDEFSLVNFGHQVGPGHPRYFPRGKETSETALTFFRRHPDRTIDEKNLSTRANEAASFLSAIQEQHGRKAYLVGYSSGAVMAAAIAAQHPTAMAGAILLRPERPFGDQSFPDLRAIPFLLISGRDDDRRRGSDAELLYEQLLRAGSAAEWHDLPCGHGFDAEGRDIEFSRAWLAKRG